MFFGSKSNKVKSTLDLVKSAILQGVSQKKWDLLLLIVAVNPTFFGTPCSNILFESSQDFEDQAQ